MGGEAHSSRLSLYDRGDEQNKNLQSRELVYDYERGEVVDPETGEVLGQIYDYMPSVRASDYAEWERKIHHSVMVEERDRRLQGKVWEVGELVSAPAWLRREVLWFVKKARALKNRPSSAGGRSTRLKTSSS